VFSELEALSGDVGAREVIRLHEGEAVQIEFEALPDIDTEEDYRKFMMSQV
jgi:CTP:molybdopterin cytidylyltransferase MocA